MRAALSTRYGGPEVLSVTNLPTPHPGPGQVRLRVHATTLSRTDCGSLRAHPFFIRASLGLLRPRNHILGLDFAGEVDAVGPDVTRFAPGMRVFGLSPDQYGAHADTLCLSQDAPIAEIPGSLAYADAVLCEGAWYAETYFDHFGLGQGQRILIYGASGAIGTAAVQLAKARGADVTAVVGTHHVPLARDLGADHVIDYETCDFTATGDTYDFVLDAVGKTSFFTCRPLLAPEGRYAATDLGAWWQNIWLSLWYQLRGSSRVRFPMPVADPAMIRRFAELMEQGRLRAVIDRSYPLERIAEAYAYVETARKTGIVVIEP
jgi:NADPH:quinone reductase-like Zn-dependent oxidoreductase